MSLVEVDKLTVMTLGKSNDGGDCQYSIGIDSSQAVLAQKWRKALVVDEKCSLHMHSTMDETWHQMIQQYW